MADSGSTREVSDEARPRGSSTTASTPGRTDDAMADRRLLMFARTPAPDPGPTYLAYLLGYDRPHSIAIESPNPYLTRKMR